MFITVINHTDTIPDEELQRTLRAINRQISEDFTPNWGVQATLRLEGRSTSQPDKLSPPDMRGEAILYLWDHTDVAGALGYHDQNARGIPYGFVFTDLARQLGEDWSVTLSHEALELIADPHVNLLVAGPHPVDNRTVFHWYEMSDAVQSETYKIDDVSVSNFVLPLYFTPDTELGGRNDFLGIKHGNATLASFGINPGGYVGFYDPLTQTHETFALAGDATASKRLAIKKIQLASRKAHRISRGAIAEVVAGQRLSIPDRAARPKSSRHYEKID